jgi:diketogulonate reductase-like aldo/keto reductase
MNPMQKVEANGATIPLIGLGTWQLTGNTCARLVSEALRIGYQHVDTAAMYGNEDAVGEGVRASGVRRDEVFVTTKVWSDSLRARDFRRSAEQSLKSLKFDYVDLLLIHWPNERVPLAETIGALCQAKRDGLARHIGVSNFGAGLVEQAVKLSTEPLVNNQFELHALVDRSSVIEACRRHGLSVTAYCPIARGGVTSDRVLKRVGAAHGKSAAQVALRYLVQQGIIAIPRTSKVERLKENFAVFDFRLSDTEMAEVHGLAHRDGRVINWGTAATWD